MEAIFSNLTELHELSVKLLADLDDCIEMSGAIGVAGDSGVPQAGIIFEDLAEVGRLDNQGYACNQSDMPQQHLFQLPPYRVVPRPCKWH